MGGLRPSCTRRREASGPRPPDVPCSVRMDPRSPKSHSQKPQVCLAGIPDKSAGLEGVPPEPEGQGCSAPAVGVAAPLEKDRDRDAKGVGLL